MSPEAASVLRRFVDALGSEVQVAVRRGSGRSARWETHTEIRETVTRFDAEQGLVELELRDGRTVRLHVHERQLVKLLDASAADGTGAWGEPLSAEEAAARFLLVHLDESLATREAHPSGWWEYEDGSFTPGPPWEAFARSRRRE